MSGRIQVKELTLAAASFDLDIEDWADKAFEMGWTDGTPVFPPTRKKVLELIDYTGREPDDVVGIVTPAERLATIEAVAINCAMAGCKPEYMPVVITALEALCDPRCHLLSAQTSTVGGPPLVIVSGPVVRKLEFNYAEGALAGSGTRANGTIARALRLILWNIGEGKPGVLAKPVFATPGRWGQLICERPVDDGNPWEPMHVQSGLEPSDSAVSVIDANGQYLSTGFVRAGADPKENIQTIARQIGGGLGGATMGGAHILVLNPDAAKFLADAGWTKSGLRDAVYASAYTTVGDIQARLKREQPGVATTNTSHGYWAKRVDVNDPNAKVYSLLSPGHLFIMVTGGWGGGHVSYYFRGGQHSEDGLGLVTRKIEWDWD